MRWGRFLVSAEGEGEGGERREITGYRLKAKLTTSPPIWAEADFFPLPSFPPLPHIATRASKSKPYTRPVISKVGSFDKNNRKARAPSSPLRPEPLLPTDLDELFLPNNLLPAPPSSTTSTSSCSYTHSSQLQLPVYGNPHSNGCSTPSLLLSDAGSLSSSSSANFSPSLACTSSSSSVASLMEVSAPDTEIHLDTLDGNFGQEVEMEVEEERRRS